MKVLSAAEMRDVDRMTIEAGIPGAVLMENAGHRVVEYLVQHFSPLARHRIVILCGGGNNGGDGFVIARQLFTRYRTATLHVVNASGRETEPLIMLKAAGCPVHSSITGEMRPATLVIDALLGTGLQGPARGPMLDFIREINSGFPQAQVLAVDIPSGMNSDCAENSGEIARADHTVTFTALKIAHAMPPNCDRVGRLHVAQIGSPPSLYEHVKLNLTHPGVFRHLLLRREPDSNKGDFGHVLIVGGAKGKSGAAEMAGMGALRAGAGLVTVASSAERLSMLELMTEHLPKSLPALVAILDRKDVVAMGPGLGTDEYLRQMVRDAVELIELPMILDADGINAVAQHEWHGRGRIRILTPHPGEMARLSGIPIPEVQADRLAVARAYAKDHAAIVVLKGHRTVVAFPDSSAWINPVDSPAMATGGTGDILTGMIAGLVAQYPHDITNAILAAVYLHGRSGQIGGESIGERPFIATDVLRFLPEAMRDCVHDRD